MKGKPIMLRLSATQRRAIEKIARQNKSSLSKAVRDALINAKIIPQEGC